MSSSPGGGGGGDDRVVEGEVVVFATVGDDIFTPPPIDECPKLPGKNGVACALSPADNEVLEPRAAS